jgi:hypothetical protein
MELLIDYTTARSNELLASTVVYGERPSKSGTVKPELMTPPAATESNSPAHRVIRRTEPR